MKWKLGSYIVKYNPKSNIKSWQSQQDIKINMNGEVSNPNLAYNGTHQFSIDIYEKPTYSDITVISGTYIGATEKRINERMYLLKSDGTFDIKDKNNILYGSYTIVSGNGVSLPSVKPSSLIHYDSGLAFIYKEASQATLVKTDENGVANRKYIYSSDDLKYGEDICWDYGNYFLALNPYGNIYRIDINTGVSSLLYSFDDYQSNLASSFKRYTSIFMFQKNSSFYIGILQDGKDLLFIDYQSLDIVCKAETGMGNILAISYSNYSGDCFSVFSSKIYQTYPNTSRIDVEYLKNIISNGQITIYDEMNVPLILSVKDMSITRNSNTNEARYEITINANISYSNVGFGNKWTNGSRTI
jgi:hypothetical protein